MYTAAIYPAQYHVEVFAAPAVSPAWTLIGANTKTWTIGAPGTVRVWAVMTESTYPAYAPGENFVIVANEEFPMLTSEDRPLVVPPDSGFSMP